MRLESLYERLQIMKSSNRISFLDLKPFRGEVLLINFGHIENPGDQSSYILLTLKNLLGSWTAVAAAALKPLPRLTKSVRQQLKAKQLELSCCCCC